MTLHAHVDRSVTSSIERTFDLVADMRQLPRIFPGFGPIAAVTSVTMRDPMYATVRSADGSTAGHEIVVLERPSAIEYTLVDLSPPFSKLVREGRARWTFSPQGAGTRIVWDYTFEPTSALAGLVAWPIIRLFERAMLRAVAAVEREASAPTQT